MNLCFNIIQLSFTGAIYGHVTGNKNLESFGLITMLVFCVLGMVADGLGMVADGLEWYGNHLQKKIEKLEKQYGEYDGDR